MPLKALILNFPSSGKDFRLHIVRHFLEDFFNVDVCVNPVWGNYETKTRFLHNPFIIFNYFFVELRYLIFLFLKIRQYKYDLIIIGYPAYFEAFFLKLFFPRRNANKIFIDFFISLYDTIILDRKKFSPKSIIAKILYSIDKGLLRSFDQILVDTKKNVKRFSDMFGVCPDSFHVLFVGSKNIILKKTYPVYDIKDLQINIGWVGTFIPLHGFDKIIECANILRNENIKFHCIGNGPGNEIEQVRDKINSFNLKNVYLYNELEFEESMQILNKCNFCLGIFGDSEKANSVIPFKVFDYLYLKKPIITMKSDAILELSDFEQIYLVENNAQAIANQILILKGTLFRGNNNDKLLYNTIRNQYILTFNNYINERYK